MKKLICLILCIFLFAACTAGTPEIAEPDEQTTAPPPETTTTTTPPVTPPASKPEIIHVDNWDILELIGYFVEEIANRQYAVINRFEQEFNPELFRKYFYGFWENEHGLIVIDDAGYSVDDNYMCIDRDFFTGQVAILGDFIITDGVTGGVRRTCWVDINNPDVMYMNNDYIVGDTESGETFYTIFNKIDMPPREPPDNRLSTLGRLEFARDYEIGLDMLFYADEILENGKKFYMDNRIFGAAVYVISEAPEKLELHAILDVVEGINDVDEIMFTLEKINGKWVRTRITNIIKEDN